MTLNVHTSVMLTLLLESEKRSEQDKIQELVEAQRQMADLQKQHDRAVLQMAEAVLQHQAKLSNIREAYQALQEAKVLLIEAQSDFEVLKDKNVEIIKNLKDEEEALAEITQQMAQIRQWAIDAKAAAEDALTDEERREGEYSALAKATTLEQVESDLRAQETLAEGIEANNPHALREYQDWAQKIERQKAIHDRCTAQLADVNAKIETIRSQWEPRLDELVSRINDAFSYNFEQISCAGEVGVHKDEDFDKWAIEIKVRFRYVSPSTASFLSLLPQLLTLFHPTELAKPSNVSINTVNPAASAPFPRSSISCPCNPWPKPPSASSTRSTRVWTPATSAWCMSAWSRSPAASIHPNTSSSHPSCCPGSGTISA